MPETLKRSFNEMSRLKTPNNIIFCIPRRLRPRNAAIARRQVVLYAVRLVRHTPDAGAVDRAGRPVDDTHDQVLALPQQPPRTPVPAVHHPAVALLHHTRHADIPVPVASRGHIHVRGTRMELHGLVVLLFHIAHDHRARRLHTRGRARPKVQAAVQTDDNR